MSTLVGKQDVPNYEIVAHHIKALGARAVFGLMSEDTAMLVATLDSIGVRFFSARHENTAIGMAEGYAAATGELGIAIIGRGPATANGLHAATYAARTGSRVLLITGDASSHQSPHGLGPDTKAFRSADVLAAAGLTCFRPYSSASLQITMQDALAHANRGNLAVFMLPINIQGARGQMTQIDVNPPSGISKLRPAARSIEVAAEALRNAKRPLIIAGRGAWQSGAKASIERLADKVGALLATSLKAKDMFRGNPYHIGIVGSFSFAIGRRFIEQADCIIVLGASLNQRTTSFGKALPENASIIHVDQHRENAGRWHRANIVVAADVEETVSALLEYFPDSPKNETGFHTQENRELIRDFSPESEFIPANTNHTADPRQLALALDAILPDDRCLAWDAGNFLGVLPYLRVADPSHLKNSSEFGSIGLGISTAMGFAVGRTQSPSYLFVGDGGLLMTLGELETIAREDIPLLVFVFNDRAYGAETHFLEMKGFPVGKSLFADVDFAGLAEQFGFETATIRSVKDLENIKGLISNPSGPTLIDLKINGKVPAPFTAESP